MTHRPSPAVLAAIAAAYAVLRAARTPASVPPVPAVSRWSLAGRTPLDAGTSVSARVASRWARAGRRDG